MSSTETKLFYSTMFQLWLDSSDNYDTKENTYKHVFVSCPYPEVTTSKSHDVQLYYYRKAYEQNTLDLGVPTSYPPSATTTATSPPFGSYIITDDDDVFLYGLSFWKTETGGLSSAGNNSQVGYVFVSVDYGLVKLEDYILPVICDGAEKHAYGSKRNLSLGTSGHVRLPRGSKVNVVFVPAHLNDNATFCFELFFYKIIN